MIDEVSERIGVRSERLKAVVKVEANFNAGARSRSGAIGLMQLMPCHFYRHNLRNRFDPEANLLIAPGF